MITEPAGEPMRQLHDRQPVILNPAYYDAWLNAETPAGDLKGLLSHDIDAQLQFNRVGREVNSAAINKQPNDHSGLVGPINPL
ncbi:SOS response-associated peptidase family protein [Mesorhizobium sp.]|uniref:SOS response-associated peptidase family protein n=1 Tax=Mesorhizobium sp. TaxID=1871066 RepID=UPI0025DC5E67|nr:SOS response-associated peptidase family protein [Mesorhizobium sp.]